MRCLSQCLESHWKFGALDICPGDVGTYGPVIAILSNGAQFINGGNVQNREIYGLIAQCWIEIRASGQNAEWLTCFERQSFRKS